MLKFADEDMGRKRMELALEYLSELLELLYFKFLPGVLLRRADCLLDLVKIYLYFYPPLFTLGDIPKENIGHVFTLLPQLAISPHWPIHNKLSKKI